MSTPEAHLDAARERLAHLAGLRHRSAAADKAIASAAATEMGRVQAALPRLAPRVHLDPSAAEAYQRAVMDRGRLNQVLASAEQRGSL